MNRDLTGEWRGGGPDELDLTKTGSLGLPHSERASTGATRCGRYDGDQDVDRYELQRRDDACAARFSGVRIERLGGTILCGG